MTVDRSASWRVQLDFVYSIRIRNPLRKLRVQMTRSNLLFIVELAKRKTAVGLKSSLCRSIGIR